MVVIESNASKFEVFFIEYSFLKTMVFGGKGKRTITTRKANSIITSLFENR